MKLILWTLFAACAFGHPSSGQAYPLKLSSNKRYLVDQNNVPFLVQGESPQALVGTLSTSEASTYFSDRQSRGFNAHWVNLLCTTYTGCSDNGRTFDNIAPFTTG